MKRFQFGEWVEASSPLTVSDAEMICNRADQNRSEFAQYPMDKVFSVLSRLKEIWSNPKHPAVVEMLEKLPPETGFSRTMVQQGLLELPFILDPINLGRKLRTELMGIPRQSLSCSPQHFSSLHWQPLGVVLHVLAGNVFVGGAGSLLEGILTGNISLLKSSSNEKVFLPKFLETLSECDPEGVVVRSIALIDYSSSQTEVISLFKRRVDGIIVWGGEDAVKAYRSDLPARTKLIVFGPKLSLAVITEAGLHERDASEVASNLSREIAIWDQNACTAPQVCYVQGLENAARLGEALENANTKTALELPPGEADLDTAIEIQKLRSVAEIAEARGEGLLWEPNPKNVGWTVLVDKDISLTPSPLHRTIRLLPFVDKKEVLKEIGALQGYVQTVGLVSGRSENSEWARELAEVGALRILDLAGMGGGEIDDPHDGSYDLPQLMKLVVTRLRPHHTDLSPIDTLTGSARQRLIDERIRVLVNHSKRAPFYQSRIGDLVIEGVKDIEKIPPLTRSEMDKNMPPKSLALSTGEYVGGYITRSGGSTGEPKFSIYDSRDWEAMISNAERVLRSMGLKEGDRLANCMLAGDLYGSFVSFDHINCRIGVTTFAFADKLDPNAFLDIWDKFSLNVVQGIPSNIIPILRSMKKIEPRFSIEKFIYAGSPLSATDSEWLRLELGVKRIASVIGANDGGQFAFQCYRMSGAVHHTIDDFNFLEIVDEDGRSVTNGESGKILITSLLKFAFPLIRYEIGDKGRFIAKVCDCGRTNRVFEYLGRCDNILNVGLLNINYSDIQNALCSFPISQLQIVSKNYDGGEVFVVRVESETGLALLKDKMLESLFVNVKKLKQRRDEGNLKGVEIETFLPGQLPRNSRSGKVKQIVDERK